MNKSLEKALYNYLMDPKNPLYNFILGKVYEDLGHTAAAASFYIRTSEFSMEYENNSLLTYEALLRLGLCFERQGSRIFTTKGVYLRALSVMPDRPEAYYLLSRIYEINKEWQESYTFAVMGEKMKDPEEPLRTNVEYPGKCGFMFEKAVTAWWLGLWDESMTLFRKLLKMPNIPWNLYEVSKNNILNLEWRTINKSPLVYNHDYHYEHLKVKFKDCHKIKFNYSQCYQDMFVLTVLNGKRNGTYLEIGCADPFYGNNTALLEKEFNWKGISIDFDKSQTDKWNGVRNSKVICADATKINYEELLKDYADIDYLQLDCDPAIITYNVLLKLPLEKHKFAVITFEHDKYIDEESNIQEKSRKYLESFGYVLVVNNIAPNDYYPYEDWWVHPNLVDMNVVKQLINISDKPKRADKYMFGRI